MNSNAAQVGIALLAIAVQHERQRQQLLHGLSTPANPAVSDGDFSLILSEETGEIAKALLEGDRVHAGVEMIHAAAVLFARLQSFTAEELDAVCVRNLRNLREAEREF